MFGSVSQDTIKNYPELFKKAKTLSNTKSRKKMLNQAKLGEFVHSLRNVDAVQKGLKKEIDVIKKNSVLSSKEKSSKIAPLNRQRKHVNARSKRASLYCERNVCIVKNVWCKKGYVKDGQMNCVKRSVSPTISQKKSNVTTAPKVVPKEDAQKPVSKEETKKPVAPKEETNEGDRVVCSTMISKPRCVMDPRTKVVKMSLQNDCRLTQDNRVVVNMAKKNPSIRISQTHVPRKTSNGRYECVVNPKKSDHKGSIVNPNLQDQPSVTSALRRMNFDKESSAFKKMAVDVFDDEIIKLIESASDKHLQSKYVTTRAIILATLQTSLKRTWIKNMLKASSAKKGGGSVLDITSTFGLILAQRGVERYLETAKGKTAASPKKR